MAVLEKMQKNSRIYVAGHRGLVGSAITRTLQARGYTNLLLRTSAEVDLRKQQDVLRLFDTEKPEFVIIAAAKVGGIQANDKLRGDFILENLQIQNHLIEASFKYKVKKLLFLGSSCIYPKLAPQPMNEKALLTGPLEYTNEAYAVAKIAGIMLCKSLAKQYGLRFISVMPTNMYGPGDNYHPEHSHVLPSLIRKFWEAKKSNSKAVSAWGTGSPFREFLYSEDLADAVLFCMDNYEDTQEHINIGSGSEVSIRELTELVKKVVGFEGAIEWDASKPDGTPRKLMDSTKLFALGWRPRTSLEDGIRLALKDFETRYSQK